MKAKHGSHYFFSYLSLIGRNSSSPTTKCVSSPSPAASCTSRHFFTMSADMSIMISFSIPPDSDTQAFSSFPAKMGRNLNEAVAKCRGCCT